MTPDQIINEIWKLPWYEVARVAIIADVILLAKTWPAYIVIISLALLIWALSRWRPPA